MSPKGIQVSISDISGGMLSDPSPLRLPLNSFQSLINTEYTRLGKLTKSKGYTIVPLTVSGELRDMKGILDDQGSLIGYLIAQDRLRYVTSLTANPSVDQLYNSCLNKIIESPSGYYYYISGDSLFGRLMRWRIKNTNISHYAGGVPSVDSSSLPIYSAKTDLAHLFRVNSKDTINDDSSMILNWAEITAVSQYYRPTTWSTYLESHSGGIITPENAIDGSETTNANLWVHAEVIHDIGRFTAIYYGIGTLVSSDNVTLHIKGQLIQGAVSIYYSINSGDTWTTVQATNPSWDGTEAIVITGPINLSYIRVKIVCHVYYPNMNGSLNISDIKVAVPESAPNGQIVIMGGSNHPGVIGPEKFNRIVVPIKTNNLSTSRDVVLLVEELDARANSVIRFESLTLPISDTAEEIDTTTLLTESWYTWDSETRRTRITLKVAVSTGSDTLIFHRAKKWFTLNNGLTSTVIPTGVIEYSDREPLMAVALENTLNVDTYAYALAGENDVGEVGNLSDPNIEVITATTVVYMDTKELKTIFNATKVTDSMSSLLVCKSLVGGIGSFYRHLTLQDSIFALLNFEDTSGDIWNLDTPTFIPPKFITDNLDTPLGVSVPDGDNRPDFDIMADTLVSFRSRAWCIVKSPDISGIKRFFIRYSEVDQFDVWLAENEISIPDDIVEIRPLREDLLLAFSLTKTYRIIPVGASFDYLKIADVGCNIHQSINTYDMIFWLNQYGIYMFDGSTITSIKQSAAMLSWIKKFNTANAKASAIIRDQRVLWTATFDGENYGLLYDLTSKALTIQQYTYPLDSYLELNGNLVTPMYVLFRNNKLGLQSGYLQDGENILTTIKSRRFQALDSSLIRLYYFGIHFNVEASGVCTIVFTFASGTRITKTIDLRAIQPLASLKVLKIQVYGNDEWFEFELTHNTADNFEIKEFFLGAAPTIVNFPERSLNA